MAGRNDQVATLLLEYADLLALTGVKAFKASAYRSAAKAISAHPDDVLSLGHEALEAIPHVGPSSAALVIEYAATGSIATLERLRARFPAAVRELRTVPGL